MKNVKNILFGGAFALTLIGAFTSHGFELIAPDYGVHPTTGLCQEGLLIEPEGQCSTSVTSISCTVKFSDNSTATAFENKTGTNCVQPLYRK